MDLKGISQSIMDIDRAMESEREREEIAFANLGQAVCDSDQKEAVPAELLTAVEDALGRIQESEETLRTVLTDEETRKSLVEETRSLKVETRNLGNRRDKALEDLGKGAWDMHKDGRGNVVLEAAIDDLVRADEKIHDAELAAHRNEQVSEGAKSSFIARGRALFLAGRRKSASASLEKLWVRAGRKVSEINDESLLADDALAPTVALLKDLDRRQAEISERISVITNETGELDSRLDKLPGKGSLKKRTTLVERSIDVEQDNLDFAYRDVGRGWMDRSGETAARGDVERCRLESRAVREEIISLEARREVFRNHKHFLEARQKRDVQEKKLRRLEQDVKELQAKVKVARKELSASDKELASLEASLPPIPEEV